MNASSAGQIRETLSPQELGQAAQQLEGTPAEEILRWAVDTYADSLSLSVSFGGAEGMVLLNMFRSLGATVHVFSLDTGFLFPDTVRFREEIAVRYGTPIEVIRPGLTVTEQARQFGEQLYTSDPDLCCYLRKVEPQRSALAGYAAWVTGIRRTQTKQRAGTPVVGWDERFGVAKIAPLASWSAEQVREYIEEHKVPLNPLLREGYKSIGCGPCTKKVTAEQGDREGRWAGTGKTECGLHGLTFSGHDSSRLSSTLRKEHVTRSPREAVE